MFTALLAERPAVPANLNDAVVLTMKLPFCPLCRISFCLNYTVLSWFSERIIDHSGHDDKSHLYKHAEKTDHGNVNIDHFEILSNGYRTNKFKRKLEEALHIKYERPSLNGQEQSVPLELFNWRSIITSRYNFKLWKKVWKNSVIYRTNIQWEQQIECNASLLKTNF